MPKNDQSDELLQEDLFYEQALNQHPLTESLYNLLKGGPNALETNPIGYYKRLAWAFEQALCGMETVVDAIERKTKKSGMGR